MRGRGRHGGFTLIEAILAIVVLAVAMPSMFLAIKGAQERRAAPVLAARARFLASEKLEDVVADRQSAARGYAYVVAANYPAEPAVPGFAGFTRTVAIAETDATLATPGTGFKKVTVTVAWTDAGSARSYQLATVLTDYTP